jgi:hypothetical protein
MLVTHKTKPVKAIVLVYSYHVTQRKARIKNTQFVQGKHVVLYNMIFRIY